MALKVTLVELGNEFNNVKTNWLKHLKGEKIDFKINFTIQTTVKIFENTDNSNKLEYAPNDFLTPDWIQTENGSFSEFFVGDTISIVDVDIPANNANYTIIEKPDDATLRLSADVTAGISANAVIQVVDIVDKCKMRFNFIENDEVINFTSKVDGNIQEIEAVGIVQGATSPAVNFVYNGSKSWQIGSSTITPDGVDADGFAKFKIEGNFTLDPFFTFDQWDNLQADIPPDYFYDFKCLKFVYRIEASYVGRSTYINQFFEDSLTSGDSGWYSEEFNNTPTNYTLDSIVLTDSGAVVIDKLILSTEEQNFTAVVKNTTNDPFNLFTKFLVQFYIAPETLEEYKNNGNNLAYNFRQDRALQLVGAVAINGEQFGVTNRQVLKTIAATLDSSEQITVTGKIAMDNALVIYLKTLPNPRYILEIITGQPDTINPELVTNGTFNTDLSGWTLTGGSGGTWTWAAPGKASITSGNNRQIRQSVTTIVGQTYRVKFDVLDYIVLSSLDAVIFGVTGISGIVANGSYTFDFVAATTSSQLRFTVTAAGSTLSIDNASVMKIVSVVSDDDIRVLLKLSSDDFTIDNSDPGMLTIASKFLDHTMSDPAIDGTATIGTAPEDEVVAYSEFFIDFDTRETDDILITDIQTKIKLKNSSTLEEFDLDPFDLPVTDQLLNFSLDRVFHIPTTEIRKPIVIKRRIDLDVLEKQYYSVLFPFKMRWEYWLRLLTVPAEFFDAGEPNNGLNNDWYRLSTFTDWDVYYEIIIKTTKNGNEIIFTDEKIIASFDYDPNVLWTPTTIKSYDGTTELITAGIQYLMGYKDTKIVAKFVNAAGAITLSNYEVNMLIEIFEQGGIDGQRRMSSLWPSDSDTWFKSTDTSNKVLLTLGTTNVANDTIIATVNVGFDLIPVATTFKVTARLYDLLGDATINGYCLKQNFSVISEEPNPTTPTLPTAPSTTKDCCSPFTVFADVANDNDFKSDRSTVDWAFSPFVDDATLQLLKWDGTAYTQVTELDNDDYGTLVAYGDIVDPSGNKVIRYTINWALVLNAFDSGSYKVQVSFSSPFGDQTKLSSEYCLSTFTEQKANGTIRIEYYLNGIMGDNTNDLKTRDFGTTNRYNSIRLPGWFGFPNSKYTKDYTVYNSGARKWIKDEQEQEFVMQIKGVMADVHELMRTDVLQADEIFVTDYNKNNAQQWIQKSVQPTSDYPPDWHLLTSKKAPVKLTFRAANNNFKKYRS